MLSASASNTPESRGVALNALTPPLMAANTRDMNPSMAVLKDVEKYLQVPYATLIHLVFGSSPSNIPEIRQSLANSGVLDTASHGTTFQWSGFGVAPARSSASEIDTFRPLVDIISEIFNQVSDSNVSFVSKPFTTPLSERQDTARLDAYVVRTTTNVAANRIRWFDIAIPLEFKKGDDLRSQQDNEQKVIWNLHSIMREDPLRRFTLGITIENTSMRLWYSSRAFLAATEPIDFLTNLEDVISLFYLIGSATEVQLGWDPTVERILVENQIQYKFKICGQLFTTTCELATYGADAMVSRGTRVWKAQDESGNIVVVKDSWRDEDREPEGAIQKRIFKDIQDKLGKEAETEAKKYFLQVLIYEDVLIGPGETDKTLELVVQEGLKWIPVEVEPVLSEKRHLSSAGHLPDPQELPTGRTRCRAFSVDTNVRCRVHARTVFQEVGIPLAEVTLLADCLACLCGSQKALYYMHLAGWVHRDFSVTNVLWVEEDGQGVGKLTDLEYAKRVDSTVSHDVRTGTMHFMAIEVEIRKYLFIPKRLRTLSQPPFRMNCLHDLESQWWSAMWVLLGHTDSKSPAKDITKQLEEFRTAFPPLYSRQTRQPFFQTFALGTLQTLADSYRDACSSIVELADHLQESYEMAAEHYPEVQVSDGLVQKVHTLALNAYSGSFERLRRSGIELIPLTKKRDSESSGNLLAGQVNKKMRQA